MCCITNAPLQHAFWLIYKKMQAEERYGRGGYICASYCPTPLHTPLAHACCGYIDVGNGEYQPAYSQMPQQGQPNYGATAGYPQ